MVFLQEFCNSIASTSSLEKNISVFSNISEGVNDSDLVVEAATENTELKLKIFEEIDRYAPKHAILASNTSSISDIYSATFIQI